MNPVVIIVKDMKNGKILLTEDELKEIVRCAYNDGYWEGKKTNWYGGITYTSSNTYNTGTPLRNDGITITCDESKRNSISGQITFDCADFMND